MSPAPAGGLARRLAGNAFQAAIGRAVALLAWLAITPVVFHALSREQFGVWSLFFALTGYLGSLDLGLAQVTLRASAAAHARGADAEAGEYATLAVLGYAALAIAWLALTPLVADPLLAFLRLPDDVRAGARFALVMGPIVFGAVGLANVTLSIAQGVGRFDLANAITLVSALGQVGGILFALRSGRGLEGVLVATAAGWTLAFLVGLAVARRAAPGFRWAPPQRALRRLGETVRFGGPMQLANAVAVFHQQVDKLLLTRAGALAAVGPYELGLRVSTASAMVPYLMLQAMLPEASALHARGEPARLRELFVRTHRYVLVASAALLAASWGGADRLFHAWLGGANEAGALALRGLAVALATALWAGTSSNTARAIGRTDLEAEYAIGALLVHVAAALALVPRWSLAGALVSLCAGNALAGLWFATRVAGVMGWPRAATVLGPLAWPLLAAAAGAVAGLAMHRALPAADGVLAWLAAAAVAGAAAGVALALLLAVRFVPPAEARDLALGLLRRGRGVDAAGGTA